MCKYPAWLTRVALIVGLSCAAVAAAPQSVGNNDAIQTVVQQPSTPGTVMDRERLQRCQREAERIERTMEWSARTNPDPRTFWAKMYEPFIKGNRYDVAVNQRMATQYLNMARNAQNENKSRVTVEKYLAVSKLYAELAAENSKLLTAMENLDDGAFHTGCSALETIERKITNQINRTPRRSWFLPSEFTDAPPAPKPGTKPADTLPKNVNPPAAVGNRSSAVQPATPAPE